MTARHPWRAVVGDAEHDGEPIVYDGRGSLLGPDTNRTARWYDLRLECGHTTQRFVRYAPRTPAQRYRRARSGDDVLPPPRRLRCEACPRTETP